MRKIAVGKKSVQMAPQFFRVRFTLKTDQNSAPFMILKVPMSRKFIPFIIILWDGQNLQKKAAK